MDAVCLLCRLIWKVVCKGVTVRITLAQSTARFRTTVQLELISVLALGTAPWVQICESPMNFYGVGLLLLKPSVPVVLGSNYIAGVW